MAVCSNFRNEYSKIGHLSNEIRKNFDLNLLIVVPLQTIFNLYYSTTQREKKN